MFEKLADAMVNMREDEALEIADALLDGGESPLDVLDCCTKSMETVGKRFEEGEYFLPELIMAGEILKQISEKVKPKLAGEAKVEKLGRVLIGTVEGDIHDIGKNILVFLLDVNGFEVRDIGIDVPRQKFVEEIKAFQPQVVGMSGLLTLAFKSMKDTIEAIT
jgi:methanogenic corrinoid protein MtbC1